MCFYWYHRGHFFTTTSNLKKNKQRDPQLNVFPQIPKEKKLDDLFPKSKESLLRNTKSDKLYILGVRWIAHLAFVRSVKACACDRTPFTDRPGTSYIIVFVWTFYLYFWVTPHKPEDLWRDEYGFQEEVLIYSEGSWFRV